MRAVILCTAIAAAVALEPAAASTAQPRIFFSDLESGPKSGGQNNAGAFVTIYGKRFGSARTSSFISVGGGRVSSYPIWTDTKITFQLGAAAATGEIVLTTASGTSNALPFIVRPGNIYFVASAGSDRNSGSFSSPWRTLLKARDSIKAGDIVYAMDGVSQTADDGTGWSTAMLIRTGGKPGAPMALVAYPGATVTIGSLTGPPTAVRTTSDSGGNWTLAGLTFRGRFSVSLTGDSNWRFVGNDMSCPNGNGSAACFIASQASNVKFMGNRVHDTGAADASAEYHGVYFTTDSNHLDIGWNKIEYVRGCRGLQVHSTDGTDQHDISIHDNVIHDIQCDGIILATVDPSKGRVDVYNNIIYNAGQGPNNPERKGGWSCISVPGTSRGSPAGVVEVYNNTLYNCGSFAAPPYPDVRTGVLYGGRSPNLRIRIRNNIIYQRPGVPYVITWTQAGVCRDARNCSSIYGSNNLFYGSGAAPSNTNITQSINGDPLFLNVEQHDFRLSSGSPAIRKGVNTGASTDINGVPREPASGYDLGAIQFVNLGISSIVRSPGVIFTPGAAFCGSRLSSRAAGDGLKLAMTSGAASQGSPWRTAGSCVIMAEREGRLSHSRGRKKGRFNELSSTPPCCLQARSAHDSAWAHRVFSNQRSVQLRAGERLRCVCSDAA